jgi:cytosine/adenosine deaminase-related metal-dependent hydrolase
MMAGVESRIVIRNGVVAGAGAATVVVQGRRIAEVSPPGRAVEGLPGDWEVDAAERLVVPGLIDAHTHLGLGALLRRAGLPGQPSATLADPRAAAWRALEDRLTPERLEPLVRDAAVGALRGGVTCALDFVRGAPGLARELLEAEARAISAAGLRAAVALGARGGRGRGAGADEVLAAAAFADSRASDRRLRGMIGLAGLADASEELLGAAAEHAARAGLHACLAEDEGDLAHAHGRWGRRPVEVLAERGLLGPRAVVAHAGTASHAEAALIADAGATLAVAPRAAMFRGAPLAPLRSFLALGAGVAFGTDGLFPEPASDALAAILALRHAERTAAAGAGLAGPVAWPAAARLASRLFGEPLGALSPGALADLVVLEWRPSSPLPDVGDGDLAILWAGAPAAWVLVDGEVRVREGHVLGADEAELAARAREAAAALLG